MHDLLPLLTACGLGSAATAASQPEQPFRSLLQAAVFADLVGSWRGELVYRDFATDDSVVLPAHAEFGDVHAGKYLVTELVVEDRGRTITSLDLTWLSDADRAVRSISWGRGGVAAESWQVESFARGDSPAGDWTLVLTMTGSDGGQPADLRLTYRLAGDELTATRAVQRAGGTDDQWRMRSEQRLRRQLVAPDAARLIGTWQVDLRPRSDAAPHFAQLAITGVEGGVFGTFYGATIRAGRINVAWGAPWLAFVTADGSGDYHSTAELQPNGTLRGTTHSLGRGFLAVWTAQRID